MYALVNNLSIYYIYLMNNSLFLFVCLSISLSLSLCLSLSLSFLSLTPKFLIRLMLNNETFKDIIHGIFDSHKRIRKWIKERGGRYIALCIYWKTISLNKKKSQLPFVGFDFWRVENSHDTLSNEYNFYCDLLVDFIIDFELTINFYYDCFFNMLYFLFFIKLLKMVFKKVVIIIFFFQKWQ